MRPWLVAGLSLLVACGPETDDGEVELDAPVVAAASLVQPPPSSAACGTIPAGFGLTTGRSLTSCDGKWRLLWYGSTTTFQAFLELSGSLYTSLKLSPAMVVHPAGPLALAMQADGNLQLVDAARGYAVWSSGTGGHAGAFAELTSDGRLRVMAGTQQLWTTAALLPLPSSPQTIGQNKSFGTHGRLTSPNGRYQFKVGGDPGGAGYVRIIDTQLGRDIWQKPLPRVGYVGRMQADGNFVVADWANGGLWTTQTDGHPGASLQMQDDGNLVVYSSTRVPLWASNTVAGTARANLVIDKARSTYNLSFGIICTVENTGTATTSGALRVRARLQQYQSAQSGTVTGTFYSTRTVNQTITAGGRSTFYMPMPTGLGINVENAQLSCEVNWSDPVAYPSAPVGYSITESSYTDNAHAILQHRAAACAAPGGDASDPDCWLAVFTGVAAAMKFEVPLSSGGISQSLAWKDWSATARANLRQATYYYQAYLTQNLYGDKLGAALDLGTNDVPNTRLDVPNTPVNLLAAVQLDTQPPETIVTPEVAWAIYIKFVALSLASELVHAVPWSVTTYNADGLKALFDSHTNFFYAKDWSRDGRGPVSGYEVTDEGGSQGVTPFSAIKIRNWVQYNQLQKGTQTDTIEALLAWSRRLWHGAYNVKYVQDATGYRGRDPLYVMLLGRMNAVQGRFTYHTGGCGFTAGLFHNVLRTLNIPSSSRDVTSANHAALYFPNESSKKYVSHGDSPYFSAHIGLPTPRASGLLLTQAQFDAWLLRTLPSSGVHLSAAELGLVSGSTMADIDDHCADKAAGRSHAQSTVAQKYAEFYSVAQLEARGFWTRLDQAVTGAGGCTAATAKLTALHDACFDRWEFAPDSGCGAF